MTDIRSVRFVLAAPPAERTEPEPFRVTPQNAEPLLTLLRLSVFRFHFQFFVQANESRERNEVKLADAPCPKNRNRLQ